VRSQAAALEEAYASLHRLGVPGILPAVHAAGVSINRSVLGGSHSVAIYPPIDSLTPIDPLSVVNTIDCGNDISLYVHIAFCETRCTFCHYAVKNYSGRGNSSHADDSEVTRYLDALKRELTFWGSKLSTTVSSIYIGGGTPLILEEEALESIINIIKNEYNVLPDAEVCIEGSPLTITAPGGEDKLRLLKEQGVTRFSFGVQSFDDLVLKYAARGYKRDLPIRASVITSQIFENWNLDLIQGLYRGSPSETWENLKVISELRPPHLTWYHGRFADRPQGDWYRTPSKCSDFEDERATLLGRTLIWQEMAALGYHQVDGNRFVREHQYVDPFKKIRTSSSRYLLGIGAASYSHVGTKAMTENCWGYVFRNEANIRSYVDCVLSGNIPISTGRVINEEELLAASYATGLRNGRVENSELRSIQKKKPALSLYYKNLVRTLRNARILESYVDDKGETGLQLSKLGRLFEDETLALFFSSAVKRTLSANSLAVT
jgi:oxygen-independent coproporphyrinogen-3 oxidase